MARESKFEGVQKYEVSIVCVSSTTKDSNLQLRVWHGQIARRFRDHLQRSCITWIPFVIDQSSTWTSLARQFKRLGIWDVVTSNVV